MSTQWGDLIRDPGDVRELLDVFDVEQPEKDRDARTRLLAVLSAQEEGHVWELLIRHATGFAAMAHSILDWCEEVDTAIAGRIQIDSSTPPVTRQALDTSWVAAAGRAVPGGDDEAVSAAMAGALALTARMNAQDLLVRYADRWPGYIDAGGTYQRGARRNHHSISPRDLGALASLRAEVETATHARAASAAPPAVQAALTHLSSALTMMRNELHREEARDAPPSPGVEDLIRQVRALLIQTALVRDRTGEAERVAAGLGDFLRTEFWLQRWRIYEIWVLVEVLRALGVAGGRVTLLGVSNSAWSIPYGNSQTPTATISFPQGDLRLYYQWRPQGTDGTNMPDIAVTDTADNALLILDPKHGRSYGRTKVARTLNRYASAFDAPLTGVVNYYPMPRYGYENPAMSSDRKLLASDISPGSANAQRLKEAMVALFVREGYSDPTSQPASRRVKRPVRGESVLLYWATREREIDEPAGWWVYRQETGPQPVELPTIDGLQFAAASPDGARLLLIGQNLQILGGATIDSVSASRTKDTRWSASGDKFFVLQHDSLRVYSHDGQLMSSLDMNGLEAASWLLASGDETVAVLRRQYQKAPEIWFLDAHGERKVAELESGADTPSGFRASMIPGRVVFKYGYRGWFRAGEDGMAPTDDREPVDVSPDGRWTVDEVREGRQRGNTLIKVTDHSDGTTHPWIRYFGDRPRHLRWSSDGRRLAFATTLGARSGSQVMMARPGNRYASPASLPDQQPSVFAWADASALRELNGVKF
jgi:hypothetical protein